MRRSSGEQRPAGAVSPRPGHPLPLPRSHPELRSPRRDPRTQPPSRACCRGEPAFAAGGTGGIEQRRAGHQEVGTENPRRESRGRAALPGPRAGSGGRWRSGGLQRGEGVPRRGPPTRRDRRRPAAFADLCAAQSRPGPLTGRVCPLRASTSRAGHFSVRLCVGAPCPSLRPVVSGCLCRWQGLRLATLGGWWTFRRSGRKRYRCSLGHFTEDQSQAAAGKGLAFRPLRCACQGVGE